VCVPRVQKLKPGSHSTLAETRMFCSQPLAPAFTAEQATADHVVVVPDLRVGPVHRGREVGQPEVLVAKAASRPSSARTAAVDEDAIGDHAKRDLVPPPNRPGLLRLLPAGIAAAPTPYVKKPTE